MRDKAHRNQQGLRQTRHLQAKVGGEPHLPSPYRRAKGGLMVIVGELHELKPRFRRQQGEQASTEGIT